MGLLHKFLDGKKANWLYNKLGSANDSEITTATIAFFKMTFLPFYALKDKKASKEQKQYTSTRAFLTEVIALTAYIGITGGIKYYATGPICKKYYEKALRKCQEFAQGKNIKIGKLEIEPDMKKIREFVLGSEKVFNDAKKLEALKSSEAGKHFKAFEEAVKNFNNSLPKGVKELKELVLPKKLYLDTKKNISHIVVCTLALTFIPWFCNVLLKPVMNKIKEHQDSKNLTIKPTQTAIVAPSNKEPIAKKPNELAFGNYFNVVRNTSVMRVGR